MTTAYTSLLGLALPVTGELSGTWGTTVNDGITNLLDSAVAGTTAITSDADVTLTTTTGASNTSRQVILLWTASGTVTRTITAPAQSKTYIVINKTGSTQSIKLVGAGPTTGVTIVANESAVCAWNGVDFVKVSTTATASSFSAGTTGFTPSTATTGAITLAGTLGTANGGTNLTTFTSGGAVYATSTSVLTTGTLPVTSGGTGLATITAGRVLYGAGTSAIGNSANLFWDSANNRFGVNTATPSVTTELVGTDAMLIPKGTTGNRPTGVSGYLRFNTTTTEFEGYNGSAWASVGGAALSNDTATATNVYPLFAAATSGTASTIYTSNAKLLYQPSTGEFQSSVLNAGNGIVVNNATISASYTIASGSNAMSVGPVTVASGQSVTISSGQRWVVL